MSRVKTKKKIDVKKKKNKQIKEGRAFQKELQQKPNRYERRVELAMEGHRLFDLRRWGTMVSTLNTYIANESRTIANFGTKANAVQEKHNALPIPLNAIDSSQGALKQNAGH